MAPAKNHQRPPFRAEHLGSLLRPQNLVDKRVALDGEKAVVIANDKELHAIEDQAIDDIVKLQLDLGYRAVNDGEYRRHQFWGTFFPALEGMEEIQEPPLDMFRLYVPDLAAFSESSLSCSNTPLARMLSSARADQRPSSSSSPAEAGHKPGESIVCVGKIKHKGSTYTTEWNYLKSKLPAEYVKYAKLTLPAPEWYHLRYQTGKAYPKDVYANDEEYFADIAKAYQAELQTLYDLGCRNVTIDDPNLACKFFSHPRLRNRQSMFSKRSRLTLPTQTSAQRRCSRASRTQARTRTPS